LAIALAAGSERCTVELTHRLTRWRSKRDVKAGGWTPGALRSGVLEADVEGKAFHRVVLTWRAVGHLARNLNMRNKPERSERGVVEQLGAAQVVDPERHVVQGGMWPMFGHRLLPLDREKRLCPYR